MPVGGFALAVGVVILVALAVLSLRSEHRRRTRLPPYGGPIIPLVRPDSDGDGDGDDGAADG